MTTQTSPLPPGLRYEVAMLRHKAGAPFTWFVVDRTGALRARRIGTGAKGLREAIWLTRVLNGMGARDA
jgi:hypothetical protein